MIGCLSLPWSCSMANKHFSLSCVFVSQTIIITIFMYRMLMMPRRCCLSFAPIRTMAEHLSLFVLLGGCLASSAVPLRGLKCYPNVPFVLVWRSDQWFFIYITFFVCWLWFKVFVLPFFQRQVSLFLSRSFFLFMVIHSQSIVSIWNERARMCVCVCDRTFFFAILLMLLLFCFITKVPFFLGILSLLFRLSLPPLSLLHH